MTTILPLFEISNATTLIHLHLVVEARPISRSGRLIQRRAHHHTIRTGGRALRRQSAGVVRPRHTLRCEWRAKVLAVHRPPRLTWRQAGSVATGDMISRK